MRILQKATCIFLLAFMALSQNSAFTQEKKDTVTELNPRIFFLYQCTSNDSIALSASISVKREEGPFALQNAILEFSASAGTETRVLGKGKTDIDGTVILKVPVNAGLPVDKDGMTTYTVSFGGKGKYTKAAESTSAKLAKITVNFSKEDSIHYIHVKATQVEKNGVTAPVKKEKISVYVPRMLSLLKIGEFDLDDNGEGRIEYPEKLVGDSLGNITVIAKIEESDKYGNVQGQSIISWGIPKQYFTAEKPTRELWTPVAPIWMIITLIIMLTGVWAHYIYAVFQLVMIKIMRKKDAP